MVIDMLHSDKEKGVLGFSSPAPAFKEIKRCNLAFARCLEAVFMHDKHCISLHEMGWDISASLALYTHT